MQYFFLISHILYRFIGTPLGRIAGIKSKNHYEATPNTILEKVYKTVSKTPDRKRLDGLAKQLDWSVRTVERWFRRRRNQDRPTMLVKFTETSWRSLFYLVVFSYGVSSVPMQPWFWDLRQCWHHFPFHTVTSEIYNYYMAEMAFYLSLILSLFNDVKRKVSTNMLRKIILGWLTYHCWLKENCE
nr:ceramide synthase 5-like [Lytechinus pictus]